MYLVTRALSLVPFFISNCTIPSGGGAETCLYFVAGNDNASATTPLKSYVDFSELGTCDFSMPTQICSATPLRGQVKGVNTTWTLSNEKEAMCLTYVVGSSTNSSQPILVVPGGKTGEINNFETGTAATVSGIGSTTNTSCSGSSGSGSSTSSSSGSSSSSTTKSSSSASQTLSLYAAHATAVTALLVLSTMLVLV